MASEALPRVMPLAGMTKLCAAMASSMVKIGLSSFTNTLALCAASRAYNISRATTTATA